MNKLPITSRVAIVRALTEGCSMRSTSRMVGEWINTVTKLLIEAGRACAEYQHDTLRNLPCKRLQLDEIWAFVGMKDKNVPDERKGEADIGSIWTWTAICAETKLIPSWVVGSRDGEHSKAFVADLAGRLPCRVQVTTDGLKADVNAIDEGFGGEVNYAVLHKIYGGATTDESRYSPAQCLGCDKKTVMREPDTVYTIDERVQQEA